MNIPWEMLFELIRELVSKCLAQGRKETDIRASLASPGGAEWWAVWRELGKQGVRGQERRACMRALQDVPIMGNLIDELIEDAKGEG